MKTFKRGRGFAYIYVHVREILKGLAFASLGEIHFSVQIYDNKTRWIYDTIYFQLRIEVCAVVSGPVRFPL